MNAIDRAAKELAEARKALLCLALEVSLQVHADVRAKVEAAFAALAAEPAERADQWRGIESAPKDGGTLLLFCKYVCTGYWSSRYERWFACVDSQTVFPTHWRPLPLPPQEQARG